MARISLFIFLLLCQFIAVSMEQESCCLFNDTETLINPIVLASEVRSAHKRDFESLSTEPARQLENKKQKRKVIVRIKVPRPRTYYLVMNDEDQSQQLHTICGVTRHAVVKNYLQLKLGNPEMRFYQKVWGKLRHDFPYHFIKQGHEHYYLDCIDRSCTYCGRHASVQSLIMHMHMHHLLTHRKQSVFYRSLMERIDDSFEKAHSLWEKFSENG